MLCHSNFWLSNSISDGPGGLQIPGVEGGPYLPSWRLLLSNATSDGILNVRDSLLAPWPRNYAIRSIIQPRLDFACRKAHVRKSQMERLDKIFVSVAKNILNLPLRSNTTIVHLACRRGGAALHLFRELLDVHTIGHAFRSLVHLCKWWPR
ncbi:hypothetical protein TNCT_319031 [Trichonephila clavata]|uniref:Uncharacterized protein n=1 Tax=Trichonephila clavata TaxID=2740835 RepID=A0A8X6GQ48_TRICU|nr:hypothetical protein TNCT_319031 [Trichonephila clavata]